MKTLDNYIEMSITLLTNKSKVARLLIRPDTLSTSSLRSLPNFMIVGAPKCGTTSLYKYLIQHPNVKPPLQKELNFFDLYFDRGIAWYRSNFPILRQDFITNEDFYQKLFD